MGRFSNTCNLLKAAKQVLFEDKRLLALPVLSAASCIVVIATPFVCVAPFRDAIERSAPADSSFVLASLFFFLFVMYYLVVLTGVFFNAVLIICADGHLRKEKVALRDAFTAAFARLPALAGWTLIYYSIGFIIRIVEEKSQGLAGYFTSVIGAAFTVSVFLIVPVIVLEKTGPVVSLKRSGELFLKTWGEEIISDLGFTIIWIVTGCLLVISAGFWGAADRGAAGGWAYGAGLITAAAGIAGILVTISLLAVFKTVLYRFACYDEVPGSYTQEQLSQAVRKR
jgi:hypothetical protein